MGNSTRWLVLLLAVSGLILGYITYRYRGYKDSSSKRSGIVSKPYGYLVGFNKMEAHEGNPPIESPGKGRAKIKSWSDTFTVIIYLQGVKPDAQYNAHLHEGTCETGGAGGVSLEPVQSDSQGRGRSRSVVAYAKLNPTMDHLIMVHNPRGQHILCADLPPIDRIKSQ